MKWQKLFSKALVLSAIVCVIRRILLLNQSLAYDIEGEVERITQELW